MFVPRTKGDLLAKRLRLKEEKLAEITGYKIKIVERAGKKAERLVHKSNPWEGADCQREKCAICQQESELGEQICTKRNILYRSSCQLCHQAGKDASYYGESARSGFERSREHHDDYEKLALKSHMLKHHLIEHENRQEKIPFSFKILKFHQSAFARQLHEAVKIQIHEKDGILNSKGEYTRCSLPRLQVGNVKIEEQLTEEEIERKLQKLGWRKRKREEKEKESLARPSKRRTRWKYSARDKRSLEKEAESKTERKEEGGARKKMKMDKLVEIENPRFPCSATLCSSVKNRAIVSREDVENLIRSTKYRKKSLKTTRKEISHEEKYSEISMVGTESVSSEEKATGSNNSKIKEKINLFETILKKKENEENTSFKNKDKQDCLNLNLELNLNFSEGIFRPAWGVKGVGIMQKYKANQGGSPATRKRPPTSNQNSAKKRIKPGNFKTIKELFQAQLKKIPPQIPPTLSPNPKKSFACTTPSTHQYLPHQHSQTSLGVFSDQINPEDNPTQLKKIA